MAASTPLTTEKFEQSMLAINVRFDETIAAFNARFDEIKTATDASFNEAKIATDDRFDQHSFLLEAVIADTGEIKRRAISLEHSVDDVQYSLSTLTYAEEKDAKTTINHELRLQRLEKVNKIKTISPAHLIDIQA